MTKRYAGALIVLAMLAGCGGGSGGGGALPQTTNPTQPAASGPLPEPPVVLPKNGVATVQLTSQIDPATGFPEFVYKGQRGMMPTIDVKPGDTIVVDVANNLPNSGGRQSDMNLHFHGLTVSPNPPGDDVITTLALPGGTLHYVVKIPANQEPGLYWYHPHVFPQTDYQVGQAGMSGAIVIDGLEQHLPGLASMKAHVIIVRDTDVTVAASSQRRAKPNEEDSNGNPCGPDPGLQPSLNGAVRPTIAIRPGERQFFRVVNATGHKNLRLAVDGESIEVVAIDGYALDVYPGTPPTETVSSIVVPPAGRAEFVVTGPASGSANFRTLCYNSGPTGDPDPENILAELHSGSSQPSMRVAHVAPLRVGAPLPRNAFSGPMPAGAIHRKVVLNEDNNGMYINGKMFNMGDAPMFTVHTGTTEQWDVVNITEEAHDFHMHQVHFLVQQINGTTVQHPFWQDSAVVPHRIPGVNGTWKPGYLTMLVDFRDPVIKGTFMFHCHILDHEDAGMMAKIQAI